MCGYFLTLSQTYENSNVNLVLAYLHAHMFHRHAGPAAFKKTTHSQCLSLKTQMFDVSVGYVWVMCGLCVAYVWFVAEKTGLLEKLFFGF